MRTPLWIPLWEHATPADWLPKGLSLLHRGAHGLSPPVRHPFSSLVGDLRGQDGGLRFHPTRHLLLRSLRLSYRRADKKVVVTAEVGGELDEISIRRLGLEDPRPTKKKDVVQVGLSREPLCAGEKDPLGANQLELRVPRGESTAVFASIRTKELAAGEYQLVRFIERSGEKVLGGLAFVIVPPKK